MRREITANEIFWVVQAQTRSVGVWSVVLMAGRAERSLSVVYLFHTPAAQQRHFVHTQTPSCNYACFHLASSSTSKIPHHQPVNHATPMDENQQPQQPCVLQNPHLAECPDFSNDSFNPIIQPLIGPNRTREQAIESLREAWRTQNNHKKALWDAQVLADQER